MTDDDRSMSRDEALRRVAWLCDAIRAALPTEPVPADGQKDDTMKPKDYRAALEKLGISQGQAATALGVDARTSRRWALGERAIPHAVAIVLRLMHHYKLKPEDVAPKK